MEVYEYLFKSDFIDYPNQLKTKQWEEKRSRILDRDNHRCQICGRTKSGWSKHDGKYYYTGIDYSCSDISQEDIVSTKLPINEFKALMQAKSIEILRTNDNAFIGISDNGILGVMNFNDFEAVKNQCKIEVNFIKHNSGLLYFLINKANTNLNDIQVMTPYLSETPIFLNVHHKHYIIQHKAWEYEDDDLVTLCNECHTKVHKAIGAPVYSDENGYMKEVHLTPCHRCQGTGYFPEYKHVENGICFRCRGARFEEFIQHASNQDNIISKEDLPF